MIVFALSYNLLLGETGLLSFGHAAYAGLGALCAAHVFNRFGVPLPLLPLVGGMGGALRGALFGFISTRRAGTAFAMITLGIGELVAAAHGLVPDWFGGEAGVPIDRASGASLWAWTFGPAREAYALIAVWCVLACVAMFAFSRTPFMRLANAVRDNPVRAAAIGCYPRRVRYDVVVSSAFFAGVAGTLGLINVELVSTESVGMVRSGSGADRDGDRRHGGVLRAGRGCDRADVFQRRGRERDAGVAVLSRAVLRRRGGGVARWLGGVGRAAHDAPRDTRLARGAARLICAGGVAALHGARLSCSPCNGPMPHSSVPTRARPSASRASLWERLRRPFGSACGCRAGRVRCGRRALRQSRALCRLVELGAHDQRLTMIHSAARASHVVGPITLQFVGALR